MAGEVQGEGLVERNFGKKRKQELVVAAIFVLISALGLALRWRGIWYESGDFQNCLSIWMDDLKGGNGIQVLSRYNGDYNMPYVTILWMLTYLPVKPIVSIKCFSMLFDFACAAAGGALAACVGEKKEKGIFLIAYSIIFLSPVSVLNSGYWGQCDSVYVGFVLLACWCMLKEKYSLCMILWGCAFAFKLQAVFGFPILLLYYWKNRKFSFLQFFLIPVTMELLCLPAILGGCSPLVTFTVYLSQMKTFPEMYYFYPNIWTFFQDTPYYVFGKMAVAGTFVLLLLGAIWILGSKKALDTGQFLPDFLWLVMTALCFLPCMHERYGYLLEMAAIIYAVTDRRKWWIAVGTQVITLLTYAPGILDWPVIDARILAVCYLFLYGMVSFCWIDGRKRYV